METNQIISSIFEICIIPLLGVLVPFLISWIKARTNSIKEKTDNELYRKYLTMAENTVTNCVIMTQQTYVDSLKEAGGFGPDEQKIAFEKTYAAVKATLSQEAQKYLTEAMQDFNDYLRILIESQVRQLKA